ncbi:hypothetical protein [Methanofollis fontis]|uniref:Uncharacterized protein n=1 Tax=Methanofollis fontis TaxID=2052832 RepID=A0A483CXJ0_9EURY|nr:hypothetical protein [Methanofollis fontis]TAJ44013.1 hypothetical protein CUJ86_08185 [Methanofollis fontis]
MPGGDDSPAAYITCAGRSGWAMLNTYHAVLKGTAFRPRQVHILADPLCADAVPLIMGFELISGRYGIDAPVTIHETAPDDHRGAGMLVLSLVRDLIAEGYTIGIGITAGRKATIAAISFALAREGIMPDHLYYLGLKKGEGIARPYPMIPLHLQALHDLAEGWE